VEERTNELQQKNAALSKHNEEMQRESEEMRKQLSIVQAAIEQMQAHKTPFPDQGNMVIEQETYPVLPLDSVAVDDLTSGDIVTIQQEGTNNYFQYTGRSDVVSVAHLTLVELDEHAAQTNPRCLFIVDASEHGLTLKSAFCGDYLSLMAAEAFEYAYVVATSEQQDPKAQFTLLHEPNGMRLVGWKGFHVACVSVTNGTILACRSVLPELQGRLCLSAVKKFS
jgi:hypothetical protein